VNVATARHAMGASRAGKFGAAFDDHPIVIAPMLCAHSRESTH